MPESPVRAWLGAMALWIQMRSDATSPRERLLAGAVS